MKHALRIVAYGVGGLLVAIGLTFGAYGLAGNEISHPAGPVEINRHGEVVPAEDATHERESPKPERSNDQSPSPEPTEQPSGNEGGDDHGGEDRESPTPEPTEDHEGGGTGSGDSGSGDSGSDESGSDDEPEGGGEDD